MNNGMFISVVVIASLWLGLTPACGLSERDALRQKHKPWQMHVGRENMFLDYSGSQLEEMFAEVAVATPPPPPPGVNFTVGGLKIGLRNTTRAIQVLGLEADPLYGHNFSFVPPLWNDYPHKPDRSFPGAQHLGDITLRVQPLAETNRSLWATYSSARGAKQVPAHPLPGPRPADVLEASDITAALEAPGQLDTRFPLGLAVERSWERYTPPGGREGLVLRVRLKCNASAGVRVGGLGFTVISDNTFGGLTTPQVAAGLSFMDPHVGRQSGYLTWTRADGSNTMVATPHLPNTGMEAYRPMLEDLASVQQGTYEWTVHSLAWSQEWAANGQLPHTSFPTDPLHRAAWPNPRSPWPAWHLHETLHAPNPQPWNPPTALELQPGQQVEYALRFTLAEGGPRTKDAALQAAHHPVLKAVPGTVLPTDVGSAQLFVLPPPGVTPVGAASSDPAVLEVCGPARAGAAGWFGVAVQGKARGRARVEVSLSDNTTAVAHYYITPPLSTQVSRYGQFQATTSWLPLNSSDPFGRGASVMPWDRENKAHVLQDARPFVVGLSDDAGASANLGLASKVGLAPTALQTARLDEYVNWTLDGVKPDIPHGKEPLYSLQDSTNDRILMTLFYFNHSALNTTDYYTETDKCKIFPSWCSFNAPYPGMPPRWIREYRQFNFPHQVAVFHALYRTARNHARLPTEQKWEHYLQRCVDTILAMSCYSNATGAAKFGCIPATGLMDGTVFREVLEDLKRERGPWLASASLIDLMMRQRVVTGLGGHPGWVNMEAPYGSEFNWDTTGQEEVAVWGAYFNATSPQYGDLNRRAVDAILAYMPTVPTWAYNGAAAGWGDFSNNGKWMVTNGWEREGGHYRAGLNAIPVIERFMAHPDDLYLLDVGLGGVTNVMPNIDDDGAPSMAFHMHPFVMEHDPNSGDYGLGFFGHTLGTGAYLVNHTALGWLCYLCDLPSPSADYPSQQAWAAAAQQQVAVVPRDSFGVRAYVEPLGLRLRLLTGRLLNFTVDFDLQQMTLVFAPAATDGAPRTFDDVLLEVATPAAATAVRPTLQITVTAAATAQPCSIVRGAYAIPVAGDSEPTRAVLTWSVVHNSASVAARHVTYLRPAGPRRAGNHVAQE